MYSLELTEAEKSNFLEALGILSAAADGKVDDQSLLARGVRPGLPALYKSAFKAEKGTQFPPHLFFGAISETEKYEVTLHNPLKNPDAAWRFKTELWEVYDEKVVGRSPAQTDRISPDRGLAALKAVETHASDFHSLLRLLQGYVIFSPTTPVLRGVAPETHPRIPVGLYGGNLPRAIQELIRQRKSDKRSKKICRDTLDLIDWAKSFGSTSTEKLPLFSNCCSLQNRDSI